MNLLIFIYILYLSFQPMSFNFISRLTSQCRTDKCGGYLGFQCCQNYICQSKNNNPNLLGNCIKDTNCSGRICGGITDSTCCEGYNCLINKNGHNNNPAISEPFGKCVRLGMDCVLSGGGCSDFIGCCDGPCRFRPNSNYGVCL